MNANAQMNQAQLVERVYAMTLEIEEAVQLSDWRRASRLTSERSPLLHSIAVGQEPASLELIRRIRALDIARLDAARTAQTELSQEYHAAVAGMNAARQYQSMARY
ncbi:flagellar protein FliT [Paraburkholderia sp. J12]|uniref:flagellar protein FliT n=1 Tax=Paraburkholderia sp. J12 TaxID=2805432 RepID=UPI002ABD4730|nr:flagellar protein FliT [Paraburkholderia sp. J12]